MEEAGGPTEPRHGQREPTDGAGRGVIVAGILLVVALIGVVSWVAGGGDDVVQTVERADERFPAPDTAPITPTTAAATTSAPSVAPSVATTVAPSVASTTPSVSPSSTAPTVTGPDIAQLVPFLAAFAEPLAATDAGKAQIAELLAGPRHDVASEDEVAALCAVIALDGPIELAGRWERDGRRVLTTEVAARDAPGYGECIGNDGDRLDGGSYQYIAIAANGTESAAGGFVVGAARIDQRFVNDGDDPICAIRIAPSASRYFEVYVFDTPIGSQEEATLPVAAVHQDVEALSCGVGEVVASFDMQPDAERIQDLTP